jgi:hypothetical protein
MVIYRQSDLSKQKAKEEPIGSPFALVQWRLPAQRPIGVTNAIGSHRVFLYFYMVDLFQDTMVARFLVSDQTVRRSTADVNATPVAPVLNVIQQLFD